MNSNAHFEIAATFRRAETNLRKTHPLRGSMPSKIDREHLLRGDHDNDKELGRPGLIRDVLISIMGGVSALVPMAIAFQTMMGA
jgi:hypothetical protein